MEGMQLLLSPAVLAPVLLVPLAQSPGAPAPRSGPFATLSPSVPVAVDEGAGTYAIWAVDDAAGTAQRVLAGAEFLPVQLVGYPAKDRLRVDLPTPRAQPPFAHVRLPGGGSLYRVRIRGETGIVHVTPEGVPALVLDVPDAGATPGLLAAIHVDSSGTRALVASPVIAGGDVFMLDLADPSGSACLTAARGPLDVRQESLRVSPQAAWFATRGQLYRARLQPVEGAQPVDLGLGASDRLVDELALALTGGSIAVVAEVDGEEDGRRVFHVPVSGSPVEVTSAPGVVSAPEYDDPLGPFLAVSAAGLCVAFRMEVGEENFELFVKRTDAGDPAAHLTTDPDFPAYVDSIGVFAFLISGGLCFFAGDSQLTVGDDDDLLGAADMYAAFFGASGEVSYVNVTLTSGDSEPPFELAGTLTVAEALVAPSAQRILLVEEPDEHEALLSCFRVDVPGTGVLTLLQGFEDVELASVGQHVLVHVLPDDEDDGSGRGAVHLVQPLYWGGTAIDELFVGESVAALGEACSSPDGRLASLVVTYASGERVPYVIDLPAARPRPLRLASLGSWQVSATLELSHAGNLYAGFSRAGASHVLASLQGLAIRALPVRGGAMFPLEF